MLPYRNKRAWKILLVKEERKMKFTYSFLPIKFRIFFFFAVPHGFPNLGSLARNGSQVKAAKVLSSKPTGNSPECLYL